MKNFIKRKKVWTVIIIIVLLLTGWFVYSQTNKNSSASLIEVKKGDIASEVVVTGKTKAVESVDLAFEKTGKISQISVRVNDQVFAGQLLASLNSSELSAQLQEAEASVAIQKAKLAQLKIGTRPEEIIVYETKVNNSRDSLEDAKKNLLDKIQDTYTKSEDAVRGKADQFFANSSSNSPQITITVSDFQLKINLESGRAAIETTLNSWKKSLDALTVSSGLASSAAKADQNVNQIKSFLADLAIPVNSLSTNSSLSQTTIDSYKTAISTARTNVNTAISNLSTANEGLKTAEANLAVAEKELALQKAGSTPEEIAAQEAQVAQAEANQQVYQAQLAKNFLYSPINGIITKQDAKIGEIAGASTVLVSVISQNNLEIEANVPEVDVGRIAIGNPVKITLDAFPGENFSGHVAYIDPAETIIDGVVNFKIRINFDHGNSRFKSGLTANLNIQTQTKTGVLILPQYAIMENDIGKFVKVVEGKKTKELPVTTGLRSQDGMIEIISGVSEGEKVLNIGAKNGTN